LVHLLAAAAAAMTATGCCCSAPLAWARPRASPARRGGRCRAVAAGAADVAFHPDVSRAAESLQAEFRAVDRALALNSSRVAAAFRRARVAPHVTPLVSPYSSTAPQPGIRAHSASKRAFVSAFRRVDGVRPRRRRRPGGAGRRIRRNCRRRGRHCAPPGSTFDTQHCLVSLPIRCLPLFDRAPL